MATLVRYVLWHYTVAPGDILRIGHNYLRSVWHRFLIGKHAATLLSPWHRTSAAQLSTDTSLGARIGNIIVEPMLRSVGLVIRGAVIIAGLAVLCGEVLVLALSLIAWFAWPAIVMTSLIAGTRLLIP